MTMVTAFVSVSVAPGTDEEIVKDFVKDRRVAEAWLTMGEFDILLIVKVKDAGEMNDFVNNVVRTREGVIRATTALGIESIRQD
ncbi:MAG: Lrp/AsnC family transcriptional regulator [Candidatus Thorarchaeota archaeon]